MPHFFPRALPMTFLPYDSFLDYSLHFSLHKMVVSRTFGFQGGEKKAQPRRASIPMGVPCSMFQLFDFHPGPSSIDRGILLKAYHILPLVAMNRKLAPPLSAYLRPHCYMLKILSEHRNQNICTRITVLLSKTSGPAIALSFCVRARFPTNGHLPIALRHARSRFRIHFLGIGGPSGNCLVLLGL